MKLFSHFTRYHLITYANLLNYELLLVFNSTGRPPGPEMENAVNRESYSLAAGLALGLVMLEVYATLKK